MLFKLYGYPILFLAIGIVLLLFFGLFVPSIFSNSEKFANVVSQSKNIAPNIILMFMGLSLVTSIYSSFRLWKWEKGEGDFCHSCGGITRYIINGKYSPHYRCLACGKNRAEN